MFYGAVHNILVNKGFFKIIIIISAFYKTKKCHGILLLQHSLFQVSFHLQMLRLKYLIRI